jgi:hypothetical protein
VNVRRALGLVTDDLGVDEVGEVASVGENDGMSLETA